MAPPPAVLAKRRRIAGQNHHIRNSNYDAAVFGKAFSGGATQAAWQAADRSESPQTLNPEAAKN
jgi:hypothetical protein